MGMPANRPLAALSSLSGEEFAVLQFRIQGSAEAVKRSRLALLVSTIASLAIFITEWNAYLSWYRHFPLAESFPKNEVTHEAFRNALQQFVESRVITVSLLGIRVGVSDMAVLGSLTLFVCSIWLFLSVRRHNHLVGSLLGDTKDLPLPVRKLVFYGVSAYLLFTTMTQYDAVISTLDEDRSPGGTRLSRLVIALFYLPVVVIAITILADFLSVFFFNAVLSFPHQPLGFASLDLTRKIQFIAMEVIALAIGIPTLFLCRRIIGFERSTANVLREYAKLVE